MSDLFSDTGTHRGGPDLEPGCYVRVPEGATDQDVSKIEKSIGYVKLNEQIREDYESMKGPDGQFPNGFRAARERLAEKYAVSEARVRRAVHGE